MNPDCDERIQELQQILMAVVVEHFPGDRIVFATRVQTDLGALIAARPVAGPAPPPSSDPSILAEIQAVGSAAKVALESLVLIPATVRAFREFFANPKDTRPISIDTIRRRWATELAAYLDSDKAEAIAGKFAAQVADVLAKQRAK